MNTDKLLKVGQIIAFKSYYAGDDRLVIVYAKVVKPVNSQVIKMQLHHFKDEKVNSYYYCSNLYCKDETTYDYGDNPSHCPTCFKDMTEQYRIPTIKQFIDWSDCLEVENIENFATELYPFDSD